MVETGSNLHHVRAPPAPVSHLDIHRQALVARGINAELAVVAEVKQNVHEERDGIIRARHRLKELQAKLITSTGENLLDRDEMLRQQQQKLDAELMEEKRREQELAREVEKHEEARLGLEEQYATLQVGVVPRK